MKTCLTCQHRHDHEGSKNPRYWLCMRFPWDEVEPITGEVTPPYRFCRDVLRVSCPNNTTPCVLFEPLPETGEPVVKEGIRGKSVTFREKEPTS